MSPQAARSADTKNTDVGSESLLAVSPDGRTLIVGQSLIDIATGTVQAEFSMPEDEKDEESASTPRADSCRMSSHPLRDLVRRPGTGCR